MHVAVLGAGVVGVTTAYQLLQDGHKVTLVDRAGDPASFTSFANAGLVAPGHAYAWASPRAPAMMLRSLWRNDQAIRLRPTFNIAQWSWLAKFLAECTDQRAAATTAIKARLCAYSQSILHEVVKDTGVRYDANSGGLVYFYRTPSRFTAAAARADILRRQGLVIESLDRQALVACDPGLARAAAGIAGALFARGDESGDAMLFTRALAAVCLARGMTFRSATTITAIEVRGDNVTGVASDRGPITADAYVLALGVHSPQLVRGLGIRLPIYPVKGYSMTVPVTDAAQMVRLGGVDEENLLAYCPMGDRLRLTATAEIGGYETTHRPADFAVMSARARELFGHAADFSRASYWAGLRPMTPTAVPIVDRSPFANLWLNAGHGHMGWTMSNGSARLIADLIGQRRTALDREGMRYDA